jgi:uroporphyrin-III C-methyltransferase/precorrin-2 dehydrogenase/sirohydrochlorin ferrochelatase
LLDLGARLRWVAPDAPPEYTARSFIPNDCAGVDWVFACATPTVNLVVSAAAKAHGVWVCRADAPADFRMLGTLERGALRVAISTAGRAPAAARAIRDRLDAHVPHSWGALVDLVAELRAQWPAGPVRAARLRALLQGPLAPVLESGRAPDRAAVDQWLTSQDI